MSLIQFYNSIYQFKKSHVSLSENCDFILQQSCILLIQG